MSKIPHKYDISEEIFFLNNNKVHLGRIDSVNVNLPDSKTITYTILVTSKIGYTTQYSTYTREESQCFISKEELLKSL